MVQANECCGNCLYFKEGRAKGGVCRRHPPAVFVKPTLPDNPQAEPISVFPEVSGCSWCGEYRGSLS